MDHFISENLPPHILIVDDDELISKMLSLSVERMGYRASRASCVRDALRLLEDSDFNVVITDVVMPGEDGIYLLSLIREEHPEIPVIVMTGCNQLNSAIEAVKNGAFDFLQKPFDPDYLPVILKKGIEINRLRRLETRYLMELEETVANRTEELKKASIEIYRTRSQLMQEMKSKNEFLHAVTHEMRTPMNGVIGALDLLMESGLSGEQMEFARLGRQAAENMLTLVDQVLSYSSGTGHNYCDYDNLIDPGVLVSVVVDRYRPLFAERNLSLEFSCELPKPFNVSCNSEKVQRILDILLDNALKFTERGGAEVELFAESSGNSSQKLHLTVSDTGKGVPDEMLERIFEPFVQVEPVLTRRHGGIGLGLSIARQNAEFMHGSIWCENRGGDGSRFHLLFPAETALRGEA